MATVATLTPTGPQMWNYGEMTLERFREVTCRFGSENDASKSTTTSIVKPNPPEAHISELPRALGSAITQTYQDCDSSYQYSNQYAPRRIFTKLIEPCRNDGYDNAEGDFICRVNDVIANPEGYGYEIADRLGHGTFGQVLRCVTCDNRSFAVKIIKNKPAYFQQALVEVRILQLLNRYYDTRIVKMTDYFVYRKHLCIVFEQLSMNLYDVLKQNSFRGLPINMIKSIMDQLLRALVCLQTQGIIHCDLKPENILLVTFGQENSTEISEENQILVRTGLGFKLKNRREYEETTGKRENPSRKYSRYSTLRDMIMQAPVKAGLPPEQLSEGVNTSVIC
ncbi:conserved hypothetical protein [Perkinsus marinus ATCC 50983]|uniref:Protein kinase domain-containing protein n=1 Tax=Perkinsus marinus (strain ATCC 50983 / TXsc) TaxID=423536 RepID=C5LMM3_PERM5|nr:conserved hypothetical protein [Perkinsus marinus ATCC 50983]EER02040.1 conserved hypothetical protein [Perkinsus marinus ATCC 50983]|eukprot:XP_002769322.1 conserved hypothetical protein [Perkinsus marinus ATCC 50983]